MLCKPALVGGKPRCLLYPILLASLVLPRFPPVARSARNNSRFANIYVRSHVTRDRALHVQFLSTRDAAAVAQVERRSVTKLRPVVSVLSVAKKTTMTQGTTLRVPSYARGSVRPPRTVGSIFVEEYAAL